jgi:hypothetical protein
MYNLLYVANFVFMGAYADLSSCQNALYEIYATKMNIPGQRNPELDKVIQLQLKVDKSFVCVPVKKIDNK